MDLRKTGFAICSFLFTGCGDGENNIENVKNAVRLNPETGIPIASSFDYPGLGFSADDFGFCFGGSNPSFPGKKHLGCDTLVRRTPYGTIVTAPADGIVRISSDFEDEYGRGFGAYGSDNKKNLDYYGCLVVLEHEKEGGGHVTSLLGHLKCEMQAYDAAGKIGNPGRGTIVRKGQYIGHIGHYWHGADKSNDWSHLHFGIRKGRFNASYERDQLSAYVVGYAPSGDFQYDGISERYRHEGWLDPIEFIEAHKDPVNTERVLRHPPGALLKDAYGEYWQVVTEREVAQIPARVFVEDRYAVSKTVSVTDEEMSCYVKTGAIRSLGPQAIYRRPFTNTISVAYHERGERFDFVRWEAFLSWGLSELDIIPGADVIYYELFFVPRGNRLMRTGALVKGDAESEVSIVTPLQTRMPISGADVFERLGFKWSNVVTIPQGVLNDVAGIRSSIVFDRRSMTSCAVPEPCSGDGICGGGGIDALEFGDLEPLVDEDDIASDEVESVSPESVGETPVISSCTQSARRCISSDPNRYEVCIHDTATNVTDWMRFDCTPGFTCTEPYGDCYTPIPVPPASGGMGSSAQTGGAGQVVGTGGVSAGTASGGSTATPVPSGSLRLSFASPVCGSLRVEGWWIWSDGTNRGWSAINECVDADPTDCALDCALPIPSGTPYLEFTVFLPNGIGYGDEDCYGGGCGAPNGTLRLFRDNVEVTFELRPNAAGAPYYNVVVEPVP